jgi:ribosome-binding factor A
MESVRQLKYAKLIQKELGDLFLKEGRNWYGNYFITVTGVKVTPDLALARINISFFKVPDPKAVMKLIEKNIPDIRRHLGSRIGKQARIVPSLEFFHDDSLNYVEHIDKIFKDLNIPPADDNTAGNS